ncbi:hypothetical protein HZS_6762 [Henneguya salminicola]|nr:hypothetical protein HZS_6762 [Henneguya salminicola]
MYDVEAERDQIISMILDGKEIVTIKKISSFFNKDLEYCKKLFIELLAYLSQNNSYSSLNACVCCFQVKNISETVKDYKLILNSNYKENNSFIFYQKFLNKTIHTNAARAHTPEIKNVPICQNSSKTSSPKKSLTLQKRKSTSAPHVKEKPSNVVETKPQPISSILEDVHIPAPICQSSQKECSDEEPLPKHLNTGMLIILYV